MVASRSGSTTRKSGKSRNTATPKQFSTGRTRPVSIRTTSPRISPKAIWSLPSNDTDGDSRTLREIKYVIARDGSLEFDRFGNITTPESELIRGRIDGFDHGYDPIKMERAYVAELDNYQRSYYSYSYYGVDSNGDQALEARGDSPA